MDDYVSAEARVTGHKRNIRALRSHLGGMCANNNDKNKQKISLLVGGGLALLIVFIFVAALIGGWIFLNSLGFWTEVELKNEGLEEIWVTPIGYEENIRMIGPFVHIYRATPFDSKPQNIRFHLMPNESITIKYDWDDQNFQFVLVENSSGAVHIMLIDDHQLESLPDLCRCCSPPDQDLYSIPDFEQLEDALDWLLPTIQGEFVQTPLES